MAPFCVPLVRKISQYFRDSGKRGDNASFENERTTIPLAQRTRLSKGLDVN